MVEARRLDYGRLLSAGLRIIFQAELWAGPRGPIELAPEGPGQFGGKTLSAFDEAERARDPPCARRPAARPGCG
jgi:hypothetical protein